MPTDGEGMEGRNTDGALLAPRSPVTRSPAPNGRAVLPKESEAQFQAAVIKLAQINRYVVYHTHDSRRSHAGWPDLFLVRDGRAIAAEIKRQNGKTTVAQDAWLSLLAGVPGIETYVWRPSDKQRIAEILR